MSLAKTHISITDDSSYASGIDTLIPLYIFATEENKVLDETTGEVALGTTKAFANKVSIVTSKKDVINQFGVPYFATSNGTVLQGDETNEYGLYGLFDAMGNTSLAYTLRADIDLKQLRIREEEPTSNVKNGTYWLDMNNTSLGIFRCNSVSNKLANDWNDKIEVELYDHNPLESDGMQGDYAVYFDGSNQKVLEKINSKTWVEIGSEEWLKYYEGAKVYHQTSIKYPSSSQGSIWVKTSSVNNGAKYVLKRFSSVANKWDEVAMPICLSLVDAESSFGNSLTSGSICIKCDEKTANGKIYMYNPQNVGMTITGTTPTTLVEGKIVIKFVYNGMLKNIIIDVVKEDTVDTIARKIRLALNANSVKSVTAENSDGVLKIIAENISVINISESTSGVLAPLGLVAGDHEPVTKSWNEYENVVVSVEEPRAIAEDGTLWFNNDLKADIMVNNGSSWRALNDVYPNASLYVSSAEPTDNVSEESIWINTNAVDYPEIRRFIGGEWSLVNNADQTTPNGVVFADARYYVEDDVEPTFIVDDLNGKVSSNLLKSNLVDPDCPNPQTYPEDILLFNTRFATNNVKEYKSNPFVGLYDDERNYTVGAYEGKLSTKTGRWVSASGNDADGRGLFGAKAQRKMVVNALVSAIVSNEQIRTDDYDFFFACCPGYPEVDDELLSLNVDKKEMFEIISDTPKTLEPKGIAIQEWGTNANNASSHGVDGRVLKSEYMTRQYPPMGLASNIDGNEVAVPSSIAKMKNLLVLPRGQIAAGTQNGQVSNLASVGYITKEGEYSSVVVNDGLGEVLVSQNINPIMPRRNTGLLFWGESTENPIESALSDEHAIITLLRLKRDLERACLPYFFRINTESLRNDFKKSLVDVLNIYVGTGEIYDYAIEVESENTPDRINRKELWAAVAIEIAKGIEQIYIPIRVVSTGALSK